MTGPVSKLQKFSPTWHILRIFAGISLVYYAWMMFDLVTHPFSPGNNPVLLPFLFRWLSALAGTFTVVMALYILRRVRGNINGLLLLLFGVGAAGWSLRTDFGTPANGWVGFLYVLYFLCIAFPALDGLVIFFPTGQAFPARPANWAWWFLLTAVLVGFLAVLATPGSDPNFPNPIGISGLIPFTQALTILILLILPGLALISLLLRYRSGGQVERQQIRWLLWLAGMGVIVSIALTILAPTSNNNDPAMSLAARSANIAGYIYWQVFPAVAIGIALLRYRLWDIDRIIRRTLVYGVISGTLGLVYFGGVTILQWVFSAVSGQQSSVIIVISTLLITVLFAPLRRRVQIFIDRRFYRQKYDAARTIESFSATARNQVEFDNLTIQLVNVIEKTIQPESISLWLGKDR